jgi:hypothetical protein
MAKKAKKAEETIEVAPQKKQLKKQLKKEVKPLNQVGN